MPRALVIGGGVAGPAAAQLLARDGWDTHVYEAHAEPDPYAGLFLNVATNGLAVLETLGLRERLLDRRPPRRADGHVEPDRQGARHGAQRPGARARARQRHRAPQLAAPGAARGVRRGGVPTTYGARLRVDRPGRPRRARHVRGRDASRRETSSSAPTASAPRRGAHIDPIAPEPTYSGLVGVGGFARVPGLEPTPETQHFVFGARSFFGYLVRADGTTYWFANVTRSRPGRDRSTAGPTCAALHSDDPYPVPQILAATTDELRPYPIDDLVGVPRWSRGRVVALGDAVHATSPSAGQGASLALEDAAVLARTLRDEASLPEAFAAYQAARQPRTDAVVKYARAINAQKRVTTSRVGVAIRDAMMPMFLRRAANDTRNDWLYNHTVG